MFTESGPVDPVFTAKIFQTIQEEYGDVLEKSVCKSGNQTIEHVGKYVYITLNEILNFRHLVFLLLNMRK